MVELDGEAFISFREGARLRELLMAAGREAGFEPQVPLESNESSAGAAPGLARARGGDPAALRR